MRMRKRSKARDPRVAVPFRTCPREIMGSSSGVVAHATKRL
jgi:hypothetical protein